MRLFECPPSVPTSAPQPGSTATAPVHPGHFSRGVAAFALLGAGILFHLSELSGPPCAMYGGGDRRLSLELLIFLPEQGLPVIPEAALQIVGPQGKPQPRQMGTQAPLLCRQAASGSPLP